MMVFLPIILTRYLTPTYVNSIFILRNILSIVLSYYLINLKSRKLKVLLMNKKFFLRSFIIISFRNYQKIFNYKIILSIILIVGYALADWSMPLSQSIYMDFIRKMKEVYGMQPPLLHGAYQV